MADDGVIHVADYHRVYGKKTWTWGVAGDGLIWTHLLTDHDGPYNEIQAGRFQTQLSQEFMSPQRVESWTEYWYPVQGLGGGFVEEGDFRLTRQLLADTEILLTHRLQPWGKIQCRSSRDYRRPDMRITCRGAWPLRQRVFQDS